MSAADSESTSESREAHELALTVSTAQNPRAFHSLSPKVVETTWGPPDSHEGRLAPRCGLRLAEVLVGGTIGG